MTCAPPAISSQPAGVGDKKKGSQSPENGALTAAGSDTGTSMLINPLIFYVNLWPETSGLRKALPDLSATEITGQVAI